MRGPSGAAPPPPDDLAARPLPLTVLPAGTLLHRVHASARGPLFFGPGPGKPPVGRFDPASGRFGVLYCALAPEAALIETLLRNPARLTVSWRDIATRSLSTLRTCGPLRLADARGAGLSRLGTTAALFSGPYEPCALWSDALFDHPDAPDGLLYPSRHDPDGTCLALFERPATSLTADPAQPLPDLPALVGAVLDAHGKSLFGAP